MATLKFKEGITKLVVPKEGSFTEKDLTQELYDRLKSIDEKLVESIQVIKDGKERSSTEK